MFQKRIYLENGESFIEVATRIFNDEERILITFAGPKNEQETFSVASILSEQAAVLLGQYLEEAVRKEKEWPLKERE